MGPINLDGLGTLAIVAAGSIAVGGAVVGISLDHAFNAAADKDPAVIGVRLTSEQQILRKNGALCDAYLTQSFTSAMAKPPGQQIVTLHLPKNPAQSCPKT